MPEILHITAHLGGGVGKVLSRLVETSTRVGDGWRHVIACLERPEKSQFCDHLKNHGGELLICPSPDELNRRIARADIVQVEWWHHPVVSRWLCSGPLPPMRLIVWSHVSGLHPPVISPRFAATPHRFLFSSHCSLRILKGASDRERRSMRAGVVYSSGGFDDLPAAPVRNGSRDLKAGYVGSLNFAKLHPGLMDFLAAIDIPDFRLACVGDPVTEIELLSEAGARGLSGRLEMRGYRQDVAAELAGFNVLVYLLNPDHYGTTENALLEAMAMGVVPVVLNNPAERCLVRDRETGLIVGNPDEFGAAISWLAENPEERDRMSENASRTVRKRFAAERTRARLERHYRSILSEPKCAFDFRPAFGASPADWFRACQGESAWLFSDLEDAEDRRAARLEGPAYLYERTKGSVFHYRDAFPSDRRLQSWARSMAARQ